MDDEIPTDDEVLNVILQAVEISPHELVDQLVAAGHTQENVIRGIQRAFDRGKVELSSSLKLSAAPDYDAIAA